MRLYDQAVRDGCAAFPGSRPVGSILRELPGSAVLAIDNVVQYFADCGSPQDHPVALNVPSLTPPFPRCFFESDLPRVAPGAWPLMEVWRDEGWDAFGVLCLTYDYASGCPRGVHPSEHAARLKREAAWDFLGRWDPVDQPLRWVVTMSLILRHATGLRRAVGPALVTIALLGPEGGVLRLRDGRAAIASLPVSQSLMEADPEQTTWLAETFTEPCLFAIGLTHCKNVTLTQNAGRYASRQARRLAERRGDPPPTKYYTLDIEPMKRVLRDEGDVARHGLPKALHICRGHFAEYGPDFGKGRLFGKLEGRFWVPMHTRGSAEAGTIVKDYNVKAPKEDAA